MYERKNDKGNNLSVIAKKVSSLVLTFKLTIKIQKFIF